MKTLAGVVWALLFIGCSAPAPAPESPPPPEATGPVVIATATWLGDDAIEVHLELDPNGLSPDRAEVELRFRAKYFGATYADEHIDIIDDDLEASGWVDALGPLADGLYERTYRVRLAFDPESAPFGRGGVHFPVDGGWHVMGRSFLPDLWVDGEPQAVPARLTLMGPWLAGAGAGDTVIEAESALRLADSFFVVGSRLQVLERGGDHHLRVWTGATSTLSLDHTSQLAGLYLRWIADALGPLPENVETVMIGFFDPAAATRPDPETDQPTPSALADDWGSAWRDALVLSLPAGRPVSALTQAGHILVHELVHLWLPGELVIFEDWLDEGLTDYITVLVVAETLGADAEATTNVILRMWQAAQLDGRSLASSTGRAAYDHGAVTGYCLDMMLRHRQTTLVAELRTLLTSKAAGEELDSAALVAHLRSVEPSIGDWLSRAIASDEPVPIEPCLNFASFLLARYAFDGLSPKDVALSFLRITGAQTQTKAQGLVVAKVSDESVFEPGDIIRRVEGLSVATLDDVAFALRKLDPGAMAVVEFERGEMPIEGTLAVPAGAELERRVYLRAEPALN